MDNRSVATGGHWILGSVVLGLRANDPLYSALGWALFGMIVGASGILGEWSRRDDATEETNRKAHAAYFFHEIGDSQ
jgi:hypothetical protein